MQFVCDCRERKTWFRIETEAEAVLEAGAMRHAVEKYFYREYEKAKQSYKPASTSFIERDIGLRKHIERTMPVFLTLRDSEGTTLATAMLPSGGKHDPSFGIIIVGPENSDPYVEHDDAIETLGKHYGLKLPRERCYPYRR